MASGVIGDIVATDKSSYIKFASGVMLVWGETSLTTIPSASSSAYLPYSAAKDVDLSQYGFAEIFAAISNQADSAAYWNSTISKITGSVLTVTMGGDQAGTRLVRWIAIGRWR